MNVRKRLFFDQTVPVTYEPVPVRITTLLYLFHSQNGTNSIKPNNSNRFLLFSHSVSKDRVSDKIRKGPALS